MRNAIYRLSLQSTVIARDTVYTNSSFAVLIRCRLGSQTKRTSALNSLPEQRQQARTKLCFEGEIALLLILDESAAEAC